VGERVTMGVGREVREVIRHDISEEEQPETSARQSSGVVKDWSECVWCCCMERGVSGMQVGVR